jgi:hypothetical protein
MASAHRPPQSPASLALACGGLRRYSTILPPSTVTPHLLRGGHRHPHRAYSAWGQKVPPMPGEGPALDLRPVRARSPRSAFAPLSLFLVQPGVRAAWRRGPWVTSTGKEGRPGLSGRAEVRTEARRRAVRRWVCQVQGWPPHFGKTRPDQASHPQLGSGRCQLSRPGKPCRTALLGAGAARLKESRCTEPGSKVLGTHFSLGSGV